MIAERNTLHSFSNGKLDELGLDGSYCDFGFPNGHAYQFDQLAAAATLPRVTSGKLDLRSSKLDRVVRSFAGVYDGNEIHTDVLLEACRALLELLRSNGAAALRLAAKDLECNLKKVETLFKKSPDECRTLTSLLELERRSGIHRGNVLHEKSAAIGLLWIRRSLAFQSHLYHDSLVRDDRGHPRDVAVEAYAAHLSPYHGWMLRTAFPASFSQLPGRAVLLSKFGEMSDEDAGGEEEAGVVRKLGAFTGTLGPLLGAWKEEFLRLDLEDTRRV